MSDKTLNECTSIVILEALHHILYAECRRKIRKLRKRKKEPSVTYVREESNKWKNYIVIWILPASYGLRKIFPGKGGSCFMCRNTEV
jgi:hypothetical protein